MRKVLIAGIVLMIVVGLSTLALRASPHHSFRLKVGLTYKNAPVDIDIVVGCDVHEGWSLATGGSTSEVMGMPDYTFVTSMPEGHAVAIRTTPDVGAGPCHGDTTANGNVDAHWLPLIVWYEHEGDYAHGIAYATQDAYEHPNSRFGFRGAVIEKAGRLDYWRFHINGRKNLWPVYLTNYMHEPGRPKVTDPGVPLAQFIADPSKAWRYPYSIRCMGARRIKLNEAQRKFARERWPPDHPKYWGIQPDRMQARLLPDFFTHQQRFAPTNLYFAEPPSEPVDPTPEVYPIAAGDALARINPSTPGDGRYIDRILFDPAQKGFGSFDMIAPSELISAVTHKPAPWQGWYIKCQIADYVFPQSESCRGLSRWMVFENDEYVFIEDQIIQH